MNSTNRKLARDLRAAGASKDEIAELTRAGERLSDLHVPGMSAASRQRISSRLPVDVELTDDKPQRLATMRWAMAGSFALILIIAGAVWLLPGAHQTSDTQDGQRAHQVTKPEPAERKLEQQVQQLEQLQKQPVVDQKQVQKTKDDFKQTYDKYQQSHKDEKNFKSRWNNYQSEWWWKGSSASSQNNSGSDGKTQSSESQSNGGSTWRSRSRSND